MAMDNIEFGTHDYAKVDAASLVAPHRYDELAIGGGPMPSPPLTRCRCGCKSWGCLICFGFFYFWMAWTLKVVAQENQYPGDMFRTEPCDDLSFIGRDGTSLKGCRTTFEKIGAPASLPKTPFIFFSGNGYGGARAVEVAASLLIPQYKKTFGLHPAVEAFSFSYRGYSPNTGVGSASEASIMADAESFLDTVLATESAKQSGGKVLIGGHSLGCAVALGLASRRSEIVGGVVLFSPFTSMWDMDLVFWAPWSIVFFPWLWVSDRWDNIAAAAALPEEIPVALLSSGADTIISPAMQRQVFDALRTDLKWFLQTPTATHGSIDLEAKSQQQGVGDWLKISCSRLLHGC